jgi:hypothetical protein
LKGVTRSKGGECRRELPSNRQSAAVNGPRHAWPLLACLSPAVVSIASMITLYTMDARWMLITGPPNCMVMSSTAYTSAGHPMIEFVVTWLIVTILGSSMVSTRSADRRDKLLTVLPMLALTTVYPGQGPWFPCRESPSHPRVLMARGSGMSGRARRQWQVLYTLMRPYWTDRRCCSDGLDGASSLSKATAGSGRRALTVAAPTLWSWPRRLGQRQRGSNPCQRLRRGRS